MYTHNSCVYTDLGCVYTQYRIRVYTYLCIHRICVYTGSVYTHNSCVYTDLGCVYTQYMICVYTDPVYTHDLGYVYTQDLCIHIIHVYTQTWVVCIHSTGSVYTHICVYTGSVYTQDLCIHRLNVVYTVPYSELSLKVNYIIAETKLKTSSTSAPDGSAGQLVSRRNFWYW